MKAVTVKKKAEIRLYKTLAVELEKGGGLG